jgi:hypothetical protein
LPGYALDIFHHEEGPATRGCSRVQHPGDVGVVHYGQCLALDVKAGQDFFAVHARLDQFWGHGALNGLRLLRDVDDPHAPFANLPQDLVLAVAGQDGANDLAGVKLFQTQGEPSEVRVKIRIRADFTAISP